MVHFVKYRPEEIVLASEWVSSGCTNPQIFETSPFAPADFEAFSTTYVHPLILGTELSFIDQTAPADPDS